jgi:hypothetical protein
LVTKLSAPTYLLRNLCQGTVFAGLLICCLWPAIYNGGPLLDSDFPAYIRYADVAVSKITKHPSEWSQSHATNQFASTASTQSESDGEARVPFLGRSIYYGMLLRFGDAYGMMWASIALQAAALLLAIALTICHTRGFNLYAFSAIVVVLAFTTPMAFFASRLMPDVFAGIAILAAANLIIYGGRMSRACLLAWVGLLSAGLLFHSTHVLVALSLFALYLTGRLLRRGPASWIGLAAVFFSIVVAFAGDAAFAIATTRSFGVTPIRPPFLMARAIADGPGEVYLKESCPGSGFVMCRFIDRPPAATADIFLWSPDSAAGGVFTPADTVTRRALSAEQFRFVLAVLRYDPLGEIAAMARNTLDQIRKVSMFEFHLSSEDKSEFRQELPSRYLKAVEETRSWRGTMPVGLMSAVVLIVLLSATAYVLRVLLLRDNPPAEDNGLDRLAIIVIIGIVVNAFVCGALSEPYDRYQSRVVWLIPFVAALMYLRRSRMFRVAQPDSMLRFGIKSG